MTDKDEGILCLVRHLDKLIRPPQVLLVDDDPKDLELASRLLADYQCEVKTCQDATEAKALLASGAYDLAFVDLVMPGNGAEAIIRSGANPRTKVVIITGHAHPDKIEGSVLTFAKPLRADILDKFLAKRT